MEGAQSSLYPREIVTDCGLSPEPERTCHNLPAS